MDNYTGKRLDGRYEMQDVIGVGGMAVVYRAYDTLEGRTVAIKILKDEFSDNAEFLRRFKNESKAIAMLDHPNIVKVNDVSFGDRLQYIVMEYIDGISLKEYLIQQNVVKWKEAIHFNVQILHALQHAHEKGIVHRDIKPQNIMLLQDGTIKMTDFGIARFSHSETRTMTDKAIGSVHYIAPEQARGDLTDEKTDIYSVGVMLYEMTTGKLPFEADNAVSVAIMQLQADPRPPREINPAIPQGLEEITLKAMQKNPMQRYQSAADMLRDIEQFRRNPNITFQYRFFTDEKSTKYVDSLSVVDPDDFDPISLVNSRPVPTPARYEDNYQYDPEPAAPHNSQHNNSSRRMSTGGIIGIIAAAVVAAAGLGVGIFALAGGFGSGQVQEEVDLPNFVGMTREDIEKNKDNYYNFRFTYDTEVDPTQPIGVVLRQNPAGVIKVKSNAEILLVINTGEAKKKVPEVKGLKKEVAEQRVKAEGLQVEFEDVVDSETAKDYVLKAEPGEGTEVAEGSIVKLFVSKGPDEEEVSVPAVIGKDIEAARAEIIAAGLTVGTTTPQDDSSLAQNKVVECTPLPGVKVSRGTVVNLVYSSGKKTEKTITVDVSLPSGVSHDITLKAYLDGALYNSSVTVNPSYNRSYNMTLKGNTGTKKLLITLDDQRYKEFTLDFDSQSLRETASYNYVSPSNPQSTVPPQNQSDPFGGNDVMSTGVVPGD